MSIHLIEDVISVEDVGSVWLSYCGKKFKPIDKPLLERKLLDPQEAVEAIAFGYCILQDICPQCKLKRQLTIRFK